MAVRLHALPVCGLSERRLAVQVFPILFRWFASGTSFLGDSKFDDRQCDDDAVTGGGKVDGLTKNPQSID